jgi:hypothetical protein
MKAVFTVTSYEGANYIKKLTVGSKSKGRYEPPSSSADNMQCVSSQNIFGGGIILLFYLFWTSSIIFFLSLKNPKKNYISKDALAFVFRQKKWETPTLLDLHPK